MSDSYSDERSRGGLAAAAAAADQQHLQQHLQQQQQQQQLTQAPALHPGSPPPQQPDTFGGQQGYESLAPTQPSDPLPQSSYSADLPGQGYQQPPSYAQSSMMASEAPPVPLKVAGHTYDGQSQSHDQHQYQYQHQYQNQYGEHEVAPPLPERHQLHSYDTSSHPNSQNFQPEVSQQQGTTSAEYKPPLPIRHQDHAAFATPNASHNASTTGTFGQPPYDTNSFPPPPPTHRLSNKFPAGDDPSDPTHYTRDPHNLVAYLVPFPKPHLKNIDSSKVPTRFLIYTPPPPPLIAPKEGEKEGKLHKVQRKWQEEVRNAKSSTAKVTSWQGAKSRATKAIAWGVNKTTTSNLEFLGRVDGGSGAGDDSSSKPGSPSHEATTTTTTTPPPSSPPKKTVGVTDMLLVYPPSIGLNDQQMREEFVNTMLRTKSKAQRDSIIATGLLPVTYGIDILATLVWPFGGLGEIDTVWLYSSVRGAKTAHSVTKRLSSSSSSSSSQPTPSTAPAGDGTTTGTETGVADLGKDTLKLTFTASERIEILTRYLDAECHRVDSEKFPDYRNAPTESDVLEAIGWHPSQTGGNQRNWEDEQWEMTEVKDDIKSNMHKAAKEWRKFVLAFAKDPEKALKKK